MLLTLEGVLAKVLLVDAYAEYLAHCRARGLAESTVHSRAQSLRRFIAVTGNVPVWSLGARDLDAVFSRHGEWSAGTRNNRLGHYQGFFKWSRARGYMHRDNDPGFGWRLVHVSQRDRQRIPYSKWPLLFSMCETPVERMVISSGLYLFLRGSEQRAIQLQHVHLDELEIEVYRVKTRRWDLMPVSAELAVFLREHMTWLAGYGPLLPEHHLFPALSAPASGEGGRFVKGTGDVNLARPFSRPYDVVKRVLGRAGFETHGEGEHTLRRSGARAYFDELVGIGYDGALRRVQSMLGHSHASMTERYLGLDLDRRQRNEDIKGRRMFALDAKVVPIREVQRG